MFLQTVHSSNHNLLKYKEIKISRLLKEFLRHAAHGLSGLW